MQRNGKLPHSTVAVLEMPAIATPSDRVQAENGHVTVSTA